jgi:NAD-dependent SIR2 family protein deacetylase
MKLRFSDPGFYVFREFTHLFHGPSQMPITEMLNPDGFYVFPEIVFHFSSPGYENPILCSVVQFAQFLIREKKRKKKD